MEIEIKMAMTVNKLFLLCFFIIEKRLKILSISICHSINGWKPIKYGKHGISITDIKLIIKAITVLSKR